jgi:excisionase family DNA binding protein
LDALIGIRVSVTPGLDKELDMLNQITLEGQNVVGPLIGQLQERTLLTIDEVCGILRISRTTCWRLRKKGKLKSVPIGRKVLFRSRDVEDFLLSCQENLEPSRSKRGNKK